MPIIAPSPVIRQPQFSTSGLVCWHDLYDPTTSLQSIVDQSGNGYALQRGSTAGVDTNDPAWVTGGKGLSFVTDDYALTGNLSGVAINGPWTAIVAVLPSGSADNDFLWSFGAYADDNHRHSVYQSDATTLRLSSKETSATTGGSVTKSNSAYQVFSAVLSGSALVLTRLDNLSSGNITPKTVTGTPSRVTIGASAYGASQVDSATVLEHLFYNRVLSAAELQRAYRAIKTKWAGRGVTIT